MKQKNPSQKIEEEWKDFVDKNKIVKKKLDPKSNVFQESKSLSPKVQKLFRLKSVDNIELSEKKKTDQEKRKKEPREFI